MTLGIRTSRVWLISLGLALALLASLSLPPPAVRADGPILVMTSITPLADIINNVGGPRVQVINLIGVGADPHAYQPTPQDTVNLSRAQAFFANGLREEAYLNGLIANAANPKLVVVILSDGLPVVGKASTNDEFAGVGNPHLWIDPNNVIAYVAKIRDTLSQLDPAGAETYAANADSYTARLRALDTWIAAVSQTVPPQNRNLVVFHDAWAYFCARYGFINLPLVGGFANAQPSAQDYAALVTLIKSKQIPAVFGETGFNPKLVQRLAADTGVQYVANLLGDTVGPDPDTNTYLKMMTYNIQKIVTALGGTADRPTF